MTKITINILKRAEGDMEAIYHISQMSFNRRKLL